MKKLFVATAVLTTCWAGAAFADGANSTLTATLDGPSVIDGGDVDGTGSFSAVVDKNDDTLCYSLSVANIGSSTEGHIHEGGAGAPGRPVLNVSVTSGTCVSISHSVAVDMAEHPSDYYVDVVHTGTGNDAVRGQLAKTNADNG